jgi:hypothetical protein
MTTLKYAILTGVVLILVGVTSAIVAMTMTAQWWYASIPAVLGIAIVAACWLALRKKRGHGLAVAISLLIAAVGIVGSFMPSGLNFAAPGSMAFVSSIFRLITIIVCGAWIAVGIKSFFKAS